MILTVAAGLPGGNPARADDAPAGPRPPSPAELADPLRPLRLRLPVDVAASGEETARIAGARRRLAEIRERLARGSKQGCRSWAASRQRPIAPGNALVAANLAPWAGPYQTIRVFPSWVPDPETWLRVEEQLLVTASCVCPDGSPSPGGVPDGASIPGVPLAVTENIVNPAKLDLAWDPSCSIIATDYSIHEGTIGKVYRLHHVAAKTTY